MWTPAHAYLHTISLVHTENVFQSALQNAGNTATYLLQRLQARPRSPCLTQNSVGRVFQQQCYFFWFNLPNNSISGLIKPRSENIVQILVATFTLLALLPHSFYFHSILRDRWNLRLADPQVDDSILHSIYHSVVHNLKTVPCQITTTTNVMNHFCTRYALFACSFKDCHLLELCKTFCPLSDIHFTVACQG